MGDRLASFYQQVESLGGPDAKTQLALRTRIPWTRAQAEPDSLENIATFESALASMRSEGSAPLPGSGELLLGALSSLHDAMVMVFDRETRCVLAWGGTSARDGIARQIAEHLGRELRATFDGGKTHQSEMSVTVGSDEAWLSVKLAPVHDGEGRVTAVTAFASDVTERRRATLALERSAARLRSHNELFMELMARRSDLLVDPDRAFRRLTEAAGHTLDVARASIWIYDDAQSGITCLDLFEKEENRHSSGLALSASDFPAYFRGLLEERTIAADDAHTHPMTREFSEVYLKPLGIASMLDVPIWVNGEMVGVVCHEHVGPKRGWTPEDESFAFLIGSIAALVRAHQFATAGLRWALPGANRNDLLGR
jgi:PAS domain-containing protein